MNAAGSIHAVVAIEARSPAIGEKDVGLLSLL